jgi:hypothetical protein
MQSPSSVNQKLLPVSACQLRIFTSVCARACRLPAPPPPKHSVLATDVTSVIQRMGREIFNWRRMDSLFQWLLTTKKVICVFNADAALQTQAY